MNEPKYALLPDRVKAAVIDGLILVALAYATSEIFSLFDNVPDEIRMGSFVLIFILLRPIIY